MSAPAFLVSNYASTVQYSAHVVTADEEAAGHEVWHVADGRRSALDYWTGITANQIRRITVDCGAAKTLTAWGFDRGHNLAGLAGVLLERSPDNVTYTTVSSVTISATSASNTSLDAANGATTYEGAWLQRVTSVSFRYYRITIPAMGVGVLPKVVGLWLGQTWEPGNLYKPYSVDAQAPLAEVAETPWGWRGHGIITRQRSGTLTLRRITDAAYADVETHFRDNWGKGRPMWIVHDTARAERAVLADWVPGETQGFEKPTGTNLWESSFHWAEREPVVGG